MIFNRKNRANPLRVLLLTLLSSVLGSSLGIFLGQATATAQLIGSLTIEIEGLQSEEGNVCLKLFAGSQGFPNDNDSAVQRACVAITPEGEQPRTASPSPDDPDAPFRHTFENLPLGTYAVAIYHDRNGDEQLNRGAFGAPTEGYGFSNDAPANTGPARFRDAIFLVAGTETTIPIQLRYPD